MAIVIDQTALATPSYTAGSATTVAMTTTNAVAATGFITLFVGWWDASATLSSVAGGGLSWTIQIQRNMAGDENNVAIVTAPAPSGLASSTTITATFSASVPARALAASSWTSTGTLSVTGTVGADDAAGGAVTWTSGTIAASGNTRLLVAFATTANGSAIGLNTPTSPGIELADWQATNFGFATQYVIDSTSTGLSGTWFDEGNNGGCNILAAFEEPAVAPAVVLGDPALWHELAGPGASTYGPAAFLEPLFIPDVIAAGVTYQPTGSLTAGTVPSGDGVREYVGAGSLTAGTVTSGPDSTERAETGTLLVDTLPAGPDSTERTETGTLATPVLAGGADVFTAAETGTIPVGTISSGVSVYIPTGPATYTKSGSLTAGTIASSPDSFQPNETGSLASRALASGADAFTATETATAPVGALLSGVSVYVPAGVGTTYTKAGSVTTQTQPRAADAYTAADTGTIAAGALPSGAKVYVPGPVYTKTGSLTTSTQPRAADSYTRTQTGAVILTVTGSGFDSRTATETGSLLADTLLAGAKTVTGPVVPGSVSLSDTSIRTVLVVDTAGTVVTVETPTATEDVSIIDLVN